MTSAWIAVRQVWLRASLRRNMLITLEGVLRPNLRGSIQQNGSWGEVSNADLCQLSNAKNDTIPDVPRIYTAYCFQERLSSRRSTYYKLSSGNMYVLILKLCSRTAYNMRCTAYFPGMLLFYFAAFLYCISIYAWIDCIILCCMFMLQYHYILLSTDQRDYFTNYEQHAACSEVASTNTTPRWRRRRQFFYSTPSEIIP